MRLMTMIDERKRAQETGEEHSIFTFHADVNRDQQRVRLAKNGARRMKTLRHPNVLLVKDVIEIESGNELTIHVVTEAVTPLTEHLRDLPTSTDQARSISHRSPYDRVGVVNADP